MKIDFKAIIENAVESLTEEEEGKRTYKGLATQLRWKTGKDKVTGNMTMKHPLTGTVSTHKDGSWTHEHHAGTHKGSDANSLHDHITKRKYIK